MRRMLVLLIGAAVGLSSTFAHAQQVPQASAAPLQPQPLAPKAEPVQDPPYDPAEHGGLSFGTWIRATRGTAQRSTGMMATGITLDSLGAILMATGTGLWVAGNHCHESFIGPPTLSGNELRCGPMTGHAPGMALVLSGTIGLGVGLPLTIYGAADVPRAEAGAISPRATVAFGARGVDFTL